MRWHRSRIPSRSINSSSGKAASTHAPPSLLVICCVLVNRFDLDCLFARSLGECALGLRKELEVNLVK
jgi:hypothetical protein